MLIATIIFYSGRKMFVAILPIGWEKYKKEVLDSDNLKAISKVLMIFCFTAIAFSLINQSGSAWVIQAGKMNRDVNLGFLKFTFNQSQVLSIEAIFILIFTPFFSYILYPVLEKFTKVTYLKKITIGFFIIAASFAVIAYAQILLDEGKEVSIIWQVFAYALLAAGEVLMYVAGVEISYLHAPNSMKSLFSAFYALSISAGNLLTAAVNKWYITVDNPSYYWQFAGLMLVSGILFIIYAPYYESKIYLQK